MDAIAQKQRERESEIESRQRESGVSCIDLCRKNVPAFFSGMCRLKVLSCVVGVFVHVLLCFVFMPVRPVRRDQGEAAIALAVVTVLAATETIVLPWIAEIVRQWIAAVIAGVAVAEALVDAAIAPPWATVGAEVATGAALETVATVATVVALVTVVTAPLAVTTIARPHLGKAGVEVATAVIARRRQGMVETAGVVAATVVEVPASVASLILVASLVLVVTVEIAPPWATVVVAVAVDLALAHGSTQVATVARADGGASVPSPLVTDGEAAAATGGVLTGRRANGRASIWRLALQDHAKMLHPRSTTMGLQQLPRSVRQLTCGVCPNVALHLFFSRAAVRSRGGAQTDALVMQQKIPPVPLL